MVVDSEVSIINVVFPSTCSEGLQNLMVVFISRRNGTLWISCVPVARIDEINMGRAAC
jgi:hypothetical protein